MLQDLFTNLLKSLHFSNELIYLISLAITLLIVIISSGLISYLVKFIIVKIINRVLANTKSAFLQIVGKNNTLFVFSHIASGVTFWLGFNFLAKKSDVESIYIIQALSQIALLYIFISLVIFTTHVIESIEAFYKHKLKLSKHYSLQGYVNLAVFFVWVIAAILITSYYLNKSPWALLTGLGAASALLVLVFKDVLVNITSGVQLSSSKILGLGDRITSDKLGIDGTVINISSNTVQLKNDDNTTTHIPAAMLTTNIITNWHTIDRYGARKINCYLSLDSSSIQFCNPELIEKIRTLTAAPNALDKNLTNLTLYRNFIQEHLDKDPKINREFTCIIDYLTHPIANLSFQVAGLPFEIYAFSKETTYAEAKKHQAEILEYCYAALPYFNLKIK